MAEIRTVTTLTNKRLELERAIAAYEHELAKARASLSAVIAATALFDHPGPDGGPAVVDVNRLFKRGDITQVCLAAIANEGPLDTRQLATRVLQKKGFNSDDPVLRRAVALRVVNTMRKLQMRRKICDAGRERGVRIWALP